MKAKSKNMDLSTVVGAIILIAGIVFIVGLVLSVVLTWLWNSLLPGLFGFPYINVWEAWGLMAITSILFRSVPASKS